MNMIVFSARHSKMNATGIGPAPAQFSGNFGGSGSPPPATSAVAIVITLPIFVVIQH